MLIKGVRNTICLTTRRVPNIKHFALSVRGPGVPTRETWHARDGSPKLMSYAASLRLSSCIAVAQYQKFEFSDIILLLCYHWLQNAAFVAVRLSPQYTVSAMAEYFASIASFSFAGIISNYSACSTLALETLPHFMRANILSVRD